MPGLRWSWTERVLFGALLVAGAAVIVAGFREFYFSTDDAYIAFRYVRNLLDGHGLVWNPAPFHRVDGYTSFGWVMVLYTVSRLTGRMPPEVCHPLTLGLSLVTWVLFLVLACRVVDAALGGHKDAKPKTMQRFGLVALAGLGLVTNRTFLTWTSSGLETAMFTCIVTGWALALFGQRSRWAPCLVAALAALTRPEGLLVWTLTLGWLAWKLLLVGLEARRVRRRLVPIKGALDVSCEPAKPDGDARNLRLETLALAAAALTALVPVLVHALWHRLTYEAWLPNTYYAKVARPVPSMGLRYVGSFLIEYTAWPGVLLLAGFGLRAAVRRRLSSEALVVIAFVAGLLGYYGLVVGGDHFEFKAFHCIVPLYWVGVAWALGVAWAPTMRRRVFTLVTAAVLVTTSWPIAWGHHFLTRALTSRRDTFKLRYAMAPYAPVFLRGYVGAYDAMQASLIDAFYGMRHREHAAFFTWKLGEIPDAPPRPFDPANPDVALVGEVGLLAYRYPSVAVIDVFGLNDRFIARYRRTERRHQRIGHNAVPPPGYLQGFDANVVIENNIVTRRSHKVPLTPARIAAIEAAARREVRAHP